LVVFAILIQALLPAALHASSPPKRASEICTAFGIKKIAVHDSSQSDSPPGRHCPVCPPAAGIFSLLPAEPAEVFIPPPHRSFLRHQAERIFHTEDWLRPYLRGPPAFA
jgi:hypothetical protein